MSNQTPEPGSEEPTLLKSYATLKALTNDYKYQSRLGWRVVNVIEPERPTRRGIPLCILRRVSRRYRYLVIYRRPRF